MKKIILAVLYAQLVYAGINCDDKIAKIQHQMNMAKLSNTPNTIKLDYLEYKIQAIQRECVDGFIEPGILKSIEFDSKVFYEKQKLLDDEAKLQEAYAKLDRQRQKLDEKARRLKERREKLEDY